jgi:hypothetical protein
VDGFASLRGKYVLDCMMDVASKLDGDVDRTPGVVLGTVGTVLDTTDELDELVLVIDAKIHVEPVGWAPAVFMLHPAVHC